MCLTFDKIFVWNTSHSKKNSALICLEVLGVVFQKKKIHTSRNPEKYSSSGSQSNWSTTPVILGWTLINGSPGRNVSIGWERKRHRDWKHWYLLLRPYQISERFDSKFTEVGNPLVEQLGRHLRWPSVDPRPLIQGNRDRQLFLATLSFSVLFSSVVRQMARYNLQRRCTARTLPN